MSDRELKFTAELTCSQYALDIVRADFNPSHSTLVGQIKQLHAAMITMAEDLRARPLLDESLAGNDHGHVANMNYNAALMRARRNASIAITHLEDAAMHMVKAATA